ncbi:LLM class flavin-dependent oxidoreductase [Dactylosporangium sp. NPDC050588]|uniref:LLM class flavin-dependent oxidoreductase n=1 Tax=Dactylosporangium sp. NPDC050588 TaxID=3157211 RepID=UPI0033F80315
MTADPGAGIGPAGGALRVDAFLLAGQFPGAGHGDALRAAVTYARAAERAGFDGVWLAEHHFVTYGTCPSAVAMAGFVLGRTSRLRVGTGPLRHRFSERALVCLPHAHIAMRCLVIENENEYRLDRSGG